MPIRVVAIDDHPLMLKAILQQLEDCDDIQVVGTAAHGAELYRLVNETHPDVVVLDLGMPDTEAFEPITAELAEIRQAEQQAAAAVLGVEDVIFLPHDDGDLAFGLPELRRQLVALLRPYRPQVVFTHDPFTGLDG